MNIIVLIKPVSEKYVNNNSANEENLVINPYDLYALSNIVELKNKNKDIHITCISMGSLKAKNVLIRCRAIGADDVILLSDEAFAGSDTYATIYILEQAIKKIGCFDIIVCGKKAVDGETGQVGYGLAYRLGVDCFTQVNEILEVNGKNDISTFGNEIPDNKYSGTITFSHINEENEETIKTPTPVMLIFGPFMTQKNISLLCLKRSIKKPVTVSSPTKIRSLRTCHNATSFSAAAYKTHPLPSLCGLKGSKTKVLNVKSMMDKKENVVLEGTIDEKAEQFLRILKIEEIKK